MPVFMQRYLSFPQYLAILVPNYKKLFLFLLALFSTFVAKSSRYLPFSVAYLIEYVGVFLFHCLINFQNLSFYISSFHMHPRRSNVFLAFKSNGGSDQQTCREREKS